MIENSPPESRREFLSQLGLASVLASGVGPLSATAGQEGNAKAARRPWYRSTYRWGQTNITEPDPARYDVAWWRRYWKRTEIQGVIINAGGIYAYYPSRFPLHRRPEGLGNRDLYGDLARAAHDDGLTVLARMDSSRAHEEFFHAHPDWFARDAEGKPYRAGDHYISCINGPYFEEYLPAILREIIERSHPEGFADNSWSGLDRGRICYCGHCVQGFRDRTEMALPRKHDWDDPVYRRWIMWSYERRLAIWDMNNRVTRAAGGPDCLWIGMNGGSISSQSRSFRDVAAICAKAEILLLDHQSRDDSEGFHQNTETGKLLHGVLGWDKLIPESMAMYQMGRPTFRMASKPEPEARMWMLAGFAGGIQPWWHHIGAYHEDRRMYHTAEPVLRWHKANESYLVDRKPLATVGVVWSQRNTDFYGRDDPRGRVDQPWRGITRALVRARIPYLPINVDRIGSQANGLAVLILPNVAVLSDAQAAMIRRFVERGGALIATGETSRCSEWGDYRPDYALGDLFGVHGERTAKRDIRQAHQSETQHTYLRLTPERRGRVDGPRGENDPGPAGPRHPVLAGFEETDILPFGGTLAPLTLDPGAEVLMTYIPPFPIFPPETSWMRTPRTEIPGLIVNESRPGRVAFLPADIDRRYSVDGLPDHGDLLANLVRWAARGVIPLEVEGRGLVDCELYEQPGRMILHLVNLTSPGAWRTPLDEHIPIGPLRFRIRLPAGASPTRLRRLVNVSTKPVVSRSGTIEFDIDSIVDHEVVVIE
jgi:hypothetical protein